MLTPSLRSRDVYVQAKHEMALPEQQFTHPCEQDAGNMKSAASSVGAVCLAQARPHSLQLVDQQIK
jgi:hypothetical protein